MTSCAGEQLICVLSTSTEDTPRCVRKHLVTGARNRRLASLEIVLQRAASGYIYSAFFVNEVHNTTLAGPSAILHPLLIQQVQICPVVYHEQWVYLIS